MSVFEVCACPNGFAWCDGRRPIVHEALIVQCDTCRAYKRDTLPAPPPVALLDALEGEEFSS